MANKTVNKKEDASHYDDFPYVSFPFPYTNPNHLRDIGVLFGVNVPSIETARVLELGCAAGGNILNFAQTYPNSTVVGIDLSKVEIEQGQKVIKDLGLKNIELRHQSITDIDISGDKFDYIISHGVFSWVPEFVRDKILDVSKKLLTSNGIAFVSYNTLPGWNMVNTIRDMMLFHSSTFSDVTSKIDQSKLFIKFINESLEGSNSVYTNFLKEETQNLIHREDSYLRHEYLAEENHQFYFRDFIKLASDKGLSYLGEANLHSMYLGNMPDKVVEKLKVINDIIRTEQYMDFIQNRRFRCTLLVHNDVQINRNITSEIIKKFYFTCNIETDKLEKDADIKNPLETITYNLTNSKDITINTSSPALKAIFNTFIENKGNPLKAEELFKLASKKLPTIKLEEFENEFNNISGKLLFTGYMKIFATKPNSIFKISVKPKVSDLVRYQVNNIVPGKPWVTNLINEVFVLKPHERLVIEKLDGKHTIDQINEYIFENFVNGSLIAAAGDNKVTDEQAFKTLAKQCVELALDNFKVNYLLIG